MGFVILLLAAAIAALAYVLHAGLEKIAVSLSVSSEETAESIKQISRAFCADENV